MEHNVQGLFGTIRYQREEGALCVPFQPATYNIKDDIKYLGFRCIYAERTWKLDGATAEDETALRRLIETGSAVAAPGQQHAGAVGGAAAQGAPAAAPTGTPAQRAERRRRREEDDVPAAPEQRQLFFGGAVALCRQPDAHVILEGSALDHIWQQLERILHFEPLPAQPVPRWRSSFPLNDREVRPAQLCLQGRAQVRLTGGPTPREGRVEVLSNGTWRPLTDSLSVCPYCGINSECPDSQCADMGFAVAQVVWRQLGFGGGTPRHGDFYGAALAQPLLHANCSGSERGLLDCFLSAADMWFQNTLGVVFKGAEDIQEVALVSGRNGNEGRLELKHRGQWTAVQYNWQRWPRHALHTVRALCAMSGLQGGALQTGDFWGRSAVPAALVGLDCLEQEASIRQCSLGLAGAELTYPTLQGGLEVQVMGRKQWGTVGVATAREAAQVACRQLGAATGTPRLYVPAAAALPRHVDEVQCTGEEASLEACSFAAHPPKAKNDWTRGVDFGVACAACLRLELGGVLAGGADEYLPLPTALLICRLLGFPAANPNWKFSATRDGQAPGGTGVPPMLVNQLDCSGSEGSLDECTATFASPDDPCVRPGAGPEYCSYATLQCGD
ncbi:hypothetical protein ABPG75_009472 [Micractinium tetrahymenae]